MTSNHLKALSGNQPTPSRGERGKIYTKNRKSWKLEGLEGDIIGYYMIADVFEGVQKTGFAKIFFD